MNIILAMQKYYEKQAKRPTKSGTFRTTGFKKVGDCESSARKNHFCFF
jgi:hypothetical protein